eukprot:m.21084 g.21084  ORF g.21084 m.21084 type:complete len:91 (-) comp8240_c0_seq1:448-720(-)
MIPSPATTCKLPAVPAPVSREFTNADLVLRVHTKKEALQRAFLQSKAQRHLLLRTAHTNRLWQSLKQTARTTADPREWAAAAIALPVSTA